MEIGEIREVAFKSAEKYYLKERQGLKPNTEREIDMSDIRFKALKDGEVRFIRIIKLENQNESFVREITDISFWKNIVVISWRHVEEIDTTYHDVRVEQ